MYERGSVWLPDIPIEQIEEYLKDKVLNEIQCVTEITQLSCIKEFMKGFTNYDD